MKMNGVATALVAVAAILATHPRRSEAWVSAADLYPYCQVNSATGGRNCYISSRDQCEARDLCIDNPGYLGREPARQWKRKNKPQWRWWS
jgi:hypothetical protein